MRAEHWIHTIPLRLRSLFRRRQVERELDDELRYHVERQTEQNMALGMGAATARTAALRAMGGIERHKEESRDTRRVNTVENLLRDLRHALRTLRRSPGFSVVAILTLTLGIGANTAIFSVVNAVLLRPLAYKDPDELVVIRFDRASTVAAGTFLDWKEASHAFSGMGVEDYWTPNRTGSDKAEQLFGVRISGEVLPLLGVRPVLGRAFLPGEDHEGRNHVLVLSHSFWRTRFGADSGVLAQTMMLNGESYAIVGVMPAGFEFTPYWANGAMFAAPLVLDSRRNDRSGSSLRSIARMGPGVTLERARAEMATIAARLERAHPGTNQGVVLTPLHEVVVGDVKPALAILLGAVGLVLLIACANVTHLQLVRAAAREREFALRGALGASRARIVQQSLVESGILSLAGGALGLLLAREGVRVLVALAPPTIPRTNEISMDATVFGFTLAATVLAAAIFGAAPAFRVSGVPLHDALKEGGRSISESVRRRRTRGALVVSEFALAVVLLVGAGLVLRSFVALRAVEAGFDPRNVLSVQVSVTGTRQSSPERRAPFFRELVERTRALPGVRSASAISHVPLNGDNWHFPFAVEGRPFPRPGTSPTAAFLVVMPGYFHTMGIPVVRGREFTPEDQANGARVLVIDESMAKRHWPLENPIGKRISVDDPATHPDWFAVVGVVADVRQSSWTDLNADQMYFPYEQDPKAADRAMSLASFLHPEYMTLVARTDADAAGLTKPIERLVRGMDRDAPLVFPLTMEQAIAQQFAAPRFYLLLIGAFAGVALVLAAVGVYGVVSYSVERRAHEIGVRVALGARRRAILGLVVTQGMRLAVLGSAAGLVSALALTRYVRALLFQVQPTDPVTFVAVPLLLAAVAFAASWLPARRALRVDPAEALRRE